MRDFLHTKPISHLVSSPATRALQTIKPITKLLPHTPLKICESIAPDRSYEGYLELLEQYKDSQALLIVGHQPDIGLLVEYVCGQMPLVIKKGCVIELVRDSHTQWHNAFSLNLLIDPKRL